VLVPGLFLAVSWLAQSDVCVAHAAKNDESCSGCKDVDEDLLGPTSSMVQRDVLESAMSVDEEQQEAPKLAAPDARLSKVEASVVAAADARLSEGEVTHAPRVLAQPQQQMPGKFHAGSLSEDGDAGSFMDALNRGCTDSAAVGAQLLCSMKRQVAAKFRESLLCLGVSGPELVATRASWTLVLFVPLLMVGLLVLLITMRSWWKETVANKLCDGWWEPKSRPARGSFRDASSLPQPQQATHASQPPSVMDILASPGKPRGLMPGKTPQKSATPPLQQPIWLSERRSATPTRGRADSPKLALDRHLCSELVVPENSECLLLLPEIMQSRFNAGGVLSIDDVNGMAVLYAVYSLAERLPVGPHDLPSNGKRLILRSALEHLILASCRDAESETAGGPPELTIFNNSEEPFGILRATSPGPRSSYLLSLSTGKKMSIRRDNQALSSFVTNEDGWLLACSEDAGERGRKISISPQVDVGLMTLTMLGIDILDITMAARRSSGHSLPPGNASHPCTPHQQHSRPVSR